MEWYLSGCDINKDIEISDMMQLSSIDIQLQYVDRVFRQYVKSLHNKAVYRCEESLAFKSTPLVEALDQIRNPYKAVENKIDNLAAALERQLNIR
jgi:enoyl reductase-like protein